MAEFAALGLMGIIGHRMVKQVTKSEQYDAKVDQFYEDPRTTRGLGENKRIVGDPYFYGGGAIPWFPDYQAVPVDNTLTPYEQFKHAHDGNYTRVPSTSKEIKAITGRGNRRLGLSPGDAITDTTPGLNSKATYKDRRWARPPFHFQATY